MLYSLNLTGQFMFICSCWSGCAILLYPLQVLPLKGYCSYQHQNIHKLRHNRHNTAPILKCVCMCVYSWWGCVCVGVGGGGVHFSVHSSPSLTYFHGLEVSVERCSALSALFTDHGLFTMKPRAIPEEMWTQDVLSLVRACFN